MSRRQDPDQVFSNVADIGYAGSSENSLVRRKFRIFVNG